MSRLRVVEAPSRTPLELLVEDYLQHVRAAGKSKKTREFYTSVLTRIFMPWCRRENITDVVQLDQRTIDRFAAELLERVDATENKLSRVSVHTYLRTTNFFINWARAEGHAPNGKAQLPKLSRRILDVLDRSEIRALEDAAPTERDKLIVRLLADTGLRISELLGIRPEDLHKKGRDHFVRVTGKGDKERDVPLQPELYRRLERFANHGRPEDTYSDRVFLALRARPGGEIRALDVSGAEQMLRSTAEKAQITRRVYPHLLRHSFITWCLRRGMNPLQLAQIVGHEDLTMIHEVYSHLTASDAAEALMKVFRDEG